MDGFDEWVVGNYWEEVSSSNVDATKMDINNEILYVRFHDQHVYAYYGVGFDEAKEWYNSASYGKAVHYFLTPTFTYRKVV